MVFELYQSHSPDLVDNFLAYATSQAQNQKSYIGSSFSKGQAGLGIFGGFIEGNCDNLGSNDQRLADENLETRHFKRGILSMNNSGMNSNGAEFLVTFQATNYLNGYHNVIGELVSGDNVLSAIEETVSREGKIHGNWTVTSSGLQH